MIDERETRIHLKPGGRLTEYRAMFAGRPVTAEYFIRGVKVHEQVAPESLALALGTLLLPDGSMIEFEGVELTADWPVDFGRAKKLETRMRKALEQMP